MTGRDLDLTAQVVKVVTLKSAKGLEFPSVAVAGFEDPYPYFKTDALPEERVERVTQEKRTLFVGMTRAMRALLLVIPVGTRSDLLTCFDPAYWNLDVA
jgi:superfamily I DNA/RNA helicase